MSGLPEPIGRAVRRELGRFGPAAGMGAIVAAWPRAVGEAIAASAWPARVARDGTLHVATASSAWAFELTQLENTMVERLREHLGAEAPRRLRFAVGPLPEHGVDIAETSSRIAPKPGAAHVAEAERVAAGIANPALREAVARAAAASLAGAARPSDDRPVW